MGDGEPVGYVGWNVVGKLQEARGALEDALEGAQDLELHPVVVSDLQEVIEAIRELIIDADQAVRRRTAGPLAPVTPLNPDS